jgi:glycosyltransferase involved in cell wall biosynthesis
VTVPGPGLVRRLIAKLVGPTVQPSPLLDLSRLNPLLAKHGIPPLVVDPKLAGRDEAGAARFVLALLASTPALRARFPRALSDRAFCDWLTGPSASDYRLTPTAVQTIRRAFATYPGDRAWRIYEFRPDMRTVFPFGLTPQQNQSLLDWLLTHGSAEMGVTPEAAVWSILKRDEFTDRGLATSFRLNPDWQAKVPHGLTRFGWGELLQYLRANCGLTGYWVDRLPVPRVHGPWDELTLLRTARPELDRSFPLTAAQRGDARPVLDWLNTAPGIAPVVPDWRAALTREIAAGLPARPGINVLAHFRFPCGLQEEAKQIADGFESAGWRVARRGLLGNFPHFADDPAEYDAPELLDVSFIKLGAGEPLDLAYHRAGLYPRPGVYRIVGWSWELEAFPREAVERARLADEVWTPSEFCANAVRRVLTDRPVRAMPPGIAPVAPRPVCRSAFGLRDDAFTFLFVFDMASGFERKNPLGVLRAFRRAFQPGEPVQLAIKVSRGEVNPTALARLQAAVSDAGATLLDRFLPRDELAGLVALCDCYVSLHRSEGFGLTVVEAMLAGKPVIATDYSATAEYLTERNGLPVRYALVPVGPGHDPYPADAEWAEPDEAHAAERMRWAFEHREEAKKLGEAARRELSERLAPEAATRRMAARIEEIRTSRR